MKRYAKVIAGVVDNVVMSDTDLPDWFPCDDASPGWLHDAGANLFMPAPLATPEPAQRHITPLAFRRRFTLAERAAIEWAAVDRADASTQDRMNAAALRASLKDQEQAAFIDLDDPDVAAGVQFIEDLALIGTGRSAELLDAPIQPVERA